MFNFLLSFLSLTLSPIDSLNTTKKYTVYTTESQSNNKMVKTESTVYFGDFVQPLETQSSVTINPNVKFQSFLGIGAALTDAAAETFYKLDKDQQDLFLKSYFSEKEGIGYTLARTIIHSCDFSSESYTYIEEGDESLETFSIERDRKYRIPFTKRVLEVASKDIAVYASPWSPLLS